MWIHEIGHALGLKHPFEKIDEDGEVVSTPPYLSSEEDVGEWTQETYNETSDQYYLVFSPLDIAALHYLYGPNPASRADDDTYTYSSTDANFIWDASRRSHRPFFN